MYCKMKLHICFLGGIFPSPIQEEIEKESNGVIQYAADALQKALLEGIRSHFEDVYLINLPFISSFPKFYRKLLVPGCHIRQSFGNAEVFGESMSFINIPIAKMWDKKQKAYQGLCKWGEDKEGAKVIIVYSIHSPLLAAAVNYKQRKGKDVKIILVVPDLPEYMSSNKSYIYKKLKQIDRQRLLKLYPLMDGYILLTDYMKERLPMQGKPYRVIEGIYKDTERTDSLPVRNKSIFYGGTLEKRYGVMNLVNAFINLNLSDYVLEICGMGEAAEDIRTLAKLYPNIHYFGQMPREVVLKKQREAALLVNPRTPEGEFTRYSFPSKTMEYLGSGVPTLLYRLPGIPEDYYNHCFSIEEIGIGALVSAMRNILSLKEEDLLEKGREAREFILQYKNPSAQCVKLKDLIEEVTTS